jgi:hypothetical protein
MWLDQRGSEVLPRNECLRLLAVTAGGIGRVGFVVDGHLMIEPVNYRLLDTGNTPDVLVQIGPGSFLDAAGRRAVVAFEVDEVDVADGEAWSVLVRGPASVMDEAAGPPHTWPTDAPPLIPEPGRSLVRIRADSLTGRRFPLRRAE